MRPHFPHLPVPGRPLTRRLLALSSVSQWLGLVFAPVKHTGAWVKLAETGDFCGRWIEKGKVQTFFGAH